MKINKKVLIPVFATAMGLSVIGGISGAVAWYQYNTKVSASWMGVTTSDGGVLQIREVGGEWGRFANFGSADTELHPVTFGALESDAALPAKAYKHPHAGVSDMTQWDEAVKNQDYYELKFQLQALKLDPTSHQYVAVDAPVYLEEIVLGSVTDGKVDVGDAVRVHIATSSSNKIYSKAGETINTNGKLDLDKDGHNDVVGGYKWNYSEEEIVYGSGTQGAAAFVASTTAGSSNKMFDVPAAGLDVTVTIWLEGWQSLRGSAIWDATKDDGAEIHFGMKLFTPKGTFLAD